MNLKLKRLISMVTAFALSTTMLASFPVSADEPERYPYTLFAGSDKDKAITINAAQRGCVNGNIASNGTISFEKNFNFNGKKTENVNKKTVDANQKIRDKYFSWENDRVKRIEKDFIFKDVNVNLNNPFDVQGNIELEGNINFNTEIFSLNDMWLKGDTLNGNNSVLYTPDGSITVDMKNVSFSGLIYAPEGEVKISADNLNLNNVIIIADTITLEGQYININYNGNFAEFIGAEPENKDETSEEDSSEVTDNSSDAESSSVDESSQTEENSSITDETSNNDSSSQTDESGEDEKFDNKDNDKDGLVNGYEKLFGTDINKPDTDGDDLSDYQEIIITGTDPLKFDSVKDGISDARADSDEDGISNAKEIETGTNPQNADTDGDSLSDGDEVNFYGTDPLKKDTDGDGIEDGDEIKLGLDPKNSSSDGAIPDSERTFSQHIGSEAKNFAEINTEDNPFDVSMDITAAGSAINNLKSYESGYSNTIKSDMILGITPVFTYSKGLKVEDVTINFALKNEIVKNANESNNSLNDDLKGIKRYSIFKYFEDIDMLLPIDTSYDESNNKLSVHVDELGTYCIMDMQKWFSQFGVDTSKSVQNVQAVNTANLENVAKMVKTATARTLSTQDEEESPIIDVVFNVFRSNGTPQSISDEVVEAGKILFDTYGYGGNVHIYVLNYTGGAVKVKDTLCPYAVNIS